MIDKSIEPILHEELDALLIRYLSNDDYIRYCDIFRGYLNFAFKLDFICFHSYSFLLNFLCWLENNRNFDEVENDMFRYFYDSCIKDLDSKYLH